MRGFMKATSKDLRFHTKEILDAAMRGEEVTITYHGKPCVKIVRIQNQTDSNKDNKFCGMWQNREDMEDVEGYVRKIRQGRSY